MKVLNLITKIERKSLGKLLFLKNNTLFHIREEKTTENKTHFNFLILGRELCTLEEDESPIQALFSRAKGYSERLKESKKDFNLNELPIIPGNYYPRIYRPILKTDRFQSLSVSKTDLEEFKEEIYQYSDYVPFDKKHQLTAIVQLKALKELLLNIFNTIHPSKNNQKAYGNNIKNLLILSCIEVETQLKGIYKINETTSKTNYTTKDYVKLKDVLHIDKYEVTFPFYSEIKSIKPFKNWDISNPTKSLDWYDSYNAIKHNSEKDFYKATLYNSLNAFAAVAVLLIVQYGNKIPFWDENIGSFIDIKNNFSWKIEECLLPPFKENGWVIKKVDI